MQRLSFFFLLFLFLNTAAQEPVLTVGSPFPDMMIRNISNAPVKEIYLNKSADKKMYILNFWGTWCTPCIPEMDTLARLQKKNAGKMQVIAISDDNEERKAKYLAKKPSAIWLATDTSYTLYNMLSLAYVGQSAIVNAQKKIIALVRTDSINQGMIDQLLKGDTVKMSAGIKESMIQTGQDPFGVDSLMQHSFTIRGYKKGQQSMGQQYFDGPYKRRRLSWHNVTISLLYRAAYGITSYRKQEFLDASVNESELFSHDSKDKKAIYSVDLLVSEQQKDSLYIYLRRYLNLYLPVKAREEKRMIDVYVLKKKPGATIGFKPSAAENSSYGFGGRGYEGIKVTVADFAADYLTNELNLPVVDETGLAGFYDIKTTVDLRNKDGIAQSIEALGLVVEKTKREMPVLVYYK